MDQFLSALHQLVGPITELVTSLVALLVPWTPLAAWVVFWLFAVNWVKLRESLNRGGYVCLALIGLVMALVWSVIAPPEGGTQYILGLNVSNYVEKLVYVVGLFCIMLIAGSLQLSGFCSGCCEFEEPVLIADEHGHDHGGHGAADHGHAAAADTHDAHGHH